MIGQMIILGFPGTQAGEEWPDRISKMIHAGQVGGTILFSSNVVDTKQVQSLVDWISRPNGKVLPFICIDQEGGTIQRLTSSKGFVGLQSARSVARLDQASAYRLYRRTALELSTLGINVNFGPVVDLDANSESPVIGRLGRSYGSSPDRVISYAKQFINAHNEAGVLTAIKHFPGHGSAKVDPHEGIVNITATWNERELIPFRDLISNKFARMVMVGHVIHPLFSDDDRPASLSKLAIQGVLRKELGFRGLIVTDDLDMEAITARYSVEEAAVLAISAGADLIIIANNKRPDPTIVDRVISAVTKAVSEGRISSAAIEQAYLRIVAEKQSFSERKPFVGSK